MKRRLSDERGFTLHEILVAIVISSLLVGFSLSVFLFAQKLLVAHERISNLKDIVDRTLFVVSTDIEQSCRVDALSDSSLVLQAANRRVITYRFDGATIERNGTIMHDAGVRLRLTSSSMIGRSVSGPGERALQISVAGELGEMRYSAHTTALVPWSARQEFVNFASRKP